MGEPLYEAGLLVAEAGSVPSFPASNESADSWCRHGRHYFIWQRTSILFGNAPRYPLPLLLPHGGSRLGSDGGKADGRLKARAAGTVCLQTRAVARRRFQPFGRRHRNRSGGFCCFSPPKSREKRKSFPQEDRKSQKVFERTFAAAFRHRKAEKKRRRGTKAHLRTEKRCGSRVPSEAAIDKRGKTDCRQGPGLRQRATPLPRSSATRGGARCSGRHTNTPARCAAPACVPPPARPA